jgi:hypothetical protein
MAARTTEQTPADDPVLGLIAKRKAEALARAEKEHAQLAAAAKLWAQGTKLVTDAEEKLRQGHEKQDAAIVAMTNAGMDGPSVAETLGITAKAVTEATKRHRRGDEAPTAPKPKVTRAPRAKAAEAEPTAEATDAPPTLEVGEAPEAGAPEASEAAETPEEAETADGVDAADGAETPAEAESTAPEAAA